MSGLVMISVMMLFVRMLAVVAQIRGSWRCDDVGMRKSPDCRDLIRGGQS